MKLSSVVNLIPGELSATDYSEQIAEELAEQTLALQKRGSSAPVSVDEDIDLVLDRAGLSALCRLYADGHLTASQLAYTADALQLSERVMPSGPDIVDDLAECTDLEINGPLTVLRALEIANVSAAA